MRIPVRLATKAVLNPIDWIPSREVPRLIEPAHEELARFA
jgi:hypothetical protein